MYFINKAYINKIVTTSQVLQRQEDAPQLPTSYPGSMILSLIPPAWFLCDEQKNKSIANKK
jgi:hypothetical protein